MQAQNVYKLHKVPGSDVWHCGDEYEDVYVEGVLCEEAGYADVMELVGAAYSSGAWQRMQDCTIYRDAEGNYWTALDGEEE